MKTARKIQIEFFDVHKIKPLEHEISYNYKKIVSPFSDFEAFSLCGGFSNVELNKISTKYFKGVNDAKERFEAHQACINAKNTYGFDFLIECLNLPKLELDAPFNVKYIFDEFYNNEFELELNHFIEFNTEREYLNYLLKLNPEKTCIEVYIKDDSNFNNSILSINKNKSIRINKTNQILARNIFPLIKILTKFSSNIGILTKHYGLVAQRCRACNKPLTTHLSIERGYGPVCFRK